MALLAQRIENYEHLDLTKVCYWKASDGSFLIHWPNGLLGNLRGHSIQEHEDGIITVSPSIETSGCDQNGHPIKIHGHLVHGVWTDC